MNRKIFALLTVGGLLALGLSTTSGASARVSSRTASRNARSQSDSESEDYNFCTRRATTCLDPYDSIGSDGDYTGHDEPSLLWRSNKPGSGNDMTYTITLPTEPKTLPKQDGTGGTWNFELRPTFWLGMTLCDSESSPEYTHAACTPDSDSNNLVGTNPSAPDYIGKHPGNAFMELQFYGPGYVPQFEGFGCDATHYCASLTIDSLLRDQNNMVDDPSCNDYILGGLEPINWAYITKSGVSQAPANPAFTGTFQAPNLSAVTPDYTKDLLMSPGDRVQVHIYDTPAGVRIDLNDLTTGQTGFMTASIANGFGHALFRPETPDVCEVQPYAFHPMYSTANPRGTTWGAHTYNVAFSDEIGHFEFCDALDSDFNCADPGANDSSLDNDDAFCVPAEDSSLVKVTACFASDNDFDGPAYLNDWPGTNPSWGQDQKYHPSPVMFTSPTTGGDNYTGLAFEADLPRIESADNGGPGPYCNRSTGANCVNPPPGSQFYPFYSTRIDKGSCAWMEGGPYIPQIKDNFGGNSAAEYGPLLLTIYPTAPFGTTVGRYNNFHNELSTNPCPVKH